MIPDRNSVSPRWRAYAAEFLGTFLFVFVACASLVMSAYLGAQNGGSLLTIALTQGVAYGALVTALAPLSGGHLNPAITVSALVCGELTPLDAAGYVVAQCLGGVVAAVFIGSLMPVEAVAATQAGLPVFGAGMTAGRAFGLELIFAALLAVVYFGRRAGAGREQGIAVGLALFAGVALAAPLTGAALNPARALAPALTSGQTDGLWIYLLAPVFGAVLAATAVRLLRTGSADQ